MILSITFPTPNLNSSLHQVKASHTERSHAKCRNAGMPEDQNSSHATIFPQRPPCKTFPMLPKIATYPLATVQNNTQASQNLVKTHRHHYTPYYLKYIYYTIKYACSLFAISVLYYKNKNH